jgi:hypothetical protein
VVLMIYALCVGTAALCALLLLRSYAKTRFRLLLWSGLCFVGLTANNALLMLDKTLLAHIDLSAWRAAVGVVAMALLVIGLVMERGR